MKLARFPTEKEGECVWVVSHDLTFADGRFRQLRPVHVLTHLARFLVKNPGPESRIYHGCLSLENKLFGVRYHLKQMRRSCAEVGEVYHEGGVRNYDDEQEVICSLEAFLNAVYSALEVSAQINRLIYPALPIGFRDQSKKYACFDLKNRPWLRQFYDVRSELTHFGSPLPTLQADSIVINFTMTRQLEYFSKGRHEIPLVHIASYCPELFDMLDEWAKEELGKIDPEVELLLFRETGLRSPLETQMIKAKEVLALLCLRDASQTQAGVDYDCPIWSSIRRQHGEHPLRMRPPFRLTSETLMPRTIPACRLP